MGARVDGRGARERVVAGLTGSLSFPVTPMKADRSVDIHRFREHVRRQVDIGPTAIFVCCGTGEFFSLTVDEHRELVAAAVEEVDGRIPVIAGAGHGYALGIEFARSAEQQGADGLLILPPSVLRGPQSGLVDYFEGIAAAVEVPAIAYQRDTAILEPETVAELIDRVGLLALKDGHGDLELLRRTRIAVGPHLRLLNGMPTAELSVPAFSTVGAQSYSSAVQCFVPEISLCFRTAFAEGDVDLMNELLTVFFGPFATLRDRVPGYAVSLIKAGLRVRGFDAGPVRPPLIDVQPEHEEELARIVEKGLAVAG